MPVAYLGSTGITAIKHGALNITNAYRGSVPVWSASSIRDDFDRADASTLGDNWTDEGSSTDYKIGITDERSRVQIPDGIIGGFWDYRISRMRWNAETLSGDDGFVEARVATSGDNASATSLVGYRTDVMGRVSNDDFSDGVGFRLNAGQCWIVSRIDDSDDERADGGPYQPGDVIQMTFTSNTHRLFINGEQVAVWEDEDPLAASGSGYRSLGIRQEGAKDLLGPRRFSPALDYVMMG